MKTWLIYLKSGAIFEVQAELYLQNDAWWSFYDADPFVPESHTRASEIMAKREEQVVCTLATDEIAIVVTQPELVTEKGKAW